MSFLRRAFGDEERAVTTLDTPGKWQQGMVWQPNGNPGVADAGQAMRLSAVYACIRLLSEAVATLPLDTFVRRNGARYPWRPRPGYLSFDPPQGGRIDFLSQVMLSLLTDGNAYVWTPRNDMGEPVNLVVVDPDRVRVSREDGRLRYRVDETELDGTWELLHIKGMCLPGDVVGMSPIAYARETIGLGLAAQRYGASFFNNGALPSAVIEAPGEFSQAAADRFKAMWEARHRGEGNANRIGVLTGGASLNRVSINPAEAQFLEVRQFQVPDIARIFGVPPHLIADASNSTSWGSGLAEQNLAFGQFALRPWVDRIEESLGRLLTTHGLGEVFVRLNMDALLRASLRDRFDSYAVGVQNDFVTINEARSLEDMPPVPWGDKRPSQLRAEDNARSAGAGATDERGDARNLVEMVQKVYLGVGKVLTAAEARALLNRAGADLDVPGPDLANGGAQ